MNAVHIILYVSDQEKSKCFYEQVLGFSPRLHVNGMTEFELKPGMVLGLMPEAGIVRLLGPSIQDPSSSQVPRAELYLVSSEAENYHGRALSFGGRELSPMEKRSWGHFVSYCADPDEHVIAFART